MTGLSPTPRWTQRQVRRQVVLRQDEIKDLREGGVEIKEIRTKQMKEISSATFNDKGKVLRRKKVRKRRQTKARDQSLREAPTDQPWNGGR